MSQCVMLCPQEGSSGDFPRELANLLLLVDYIASKQSYVSIVCAHHQHALITSACLQTSVQGLVAHVHLA